MSFAAVGFSHDHSNCQHKANGSEGTENELTNDVYLEVGMLTDGKKNSSLWSVVVWRLFRKQKTPGSIGKGNLGQYLYVITIEKPKMLSIFAN